MRVVDLQIAGFGVRVQLHGEYACLRLPASYEPFIEDLAGEEPVLVLNVYPGRSKVDSGRCSVATGINDLGEVRLYQCGGRYSVDLSPRSGCAFRTMDMGDDFRSGVLMLPEGDKYASFTVDSMLRILFSQAIVARNAFMLHSAAVVHEGRAVLLMGKSGTGKSTHARLWLHEFDDTKLLNDDNPVVRVLADGTVMAYGSPWSGKTPCYRRESAPVQAFVRLVQAPENEFSALSHIDAFVAILPGVSVITHCRRLYSRVCSTVIEAAAHAVVGTLRCLPDAEAAEVLRDGLAASAVPQL